MALKQITQSSITHDDRHVSNDIMTNQGEKKYKTLSISATDLYNSKMSMNPAIGLFPFKNIPEYGRKNLTKPIKVVFILFYFFSSICK